MNPKDILIYTREALLKSILGLHWSGTLNTGGRNLDQPNPDPDFPARELIQSVNTFKALAIDETGMHVDYAKLAQSPAYEDFSTRISPQIRYFDPKTLDTQARMLAFWINLYNAMIIDAVIRYRVNQSVTEGYLGVVRFFRKAAYEVGGLQMSLEDIEHGILRANRGNPFLPGRQFRSTDPRLGWVVSPMDPRIHFALNCASVSCPPIGFYSPEAIDQQLDLASANFVQNEVQIIPSQGTVRLSKIFDWYQVDFGGQGGVLKFILKYLDPGEKRSWLADNLESAVLKTRRYDWHLNR